MTELADLTAATNRTRLNLQCFGVSLGVEFLVM